MRRPWLRGGLIVAVLAVLTGIGFLLGQAMLEQRRAARDVAAELPDPDVSQSIRQFHRVKVEDGRTVWDLRAEKADLLAAGRVMVEVPQLAFYAADGRSIQLSGMRGEIQLEGQDVDRIDLDGGIEVQVGRYRLETPEAVWIRSSNTVVASSGVNLKGGPLVVTGDSMVVELATRRLVVTGDVRTVITNLDDVESEASAAPEASAVPAGVAASVPSEGPPVPLPSSRVEVSRVS